MEQRQRLKKLDHFFTGTFTLNLIENLFLMNLVFWFIHTDNIAVKLLMKYRRIENSFHFEQFKHLFLMRRHRHH